MSWMNMGQSWDLKVMIKVIIQNLNKLLLRIMFLNNWMIRMTLILWIVIKILKIINSNRIRGLRKYCKNNKGNYWWDKIRARKKLLYKRVTGIVMTLNLMILNEKYRNKNSKMSLNQNLRIKKRLKIKLKKKYRLKQNESQKL